MSLASYLNPVFFMLSAELINECNFKVYFLTSLWYIMCVKIMDIRD